MEQLSELLFAPGIHVTYHGKLARFLAACIPPIKGGWMMSAVFHMVSERMRTVDLCVEHRGSVFEIPLDLADPVEFTMVKSTCFDLASALVVWSLLEKGDTFIDVGANHGYLTSVASQKVGDKGLVIAVEPTWQAYCRLVKRGLHNVIPVRRPAGETDEAGMRVVKPFYRQTTSSYYVKGVGGKSVTIDYLYEKFGRPMVKLLKIDTEGMELAVLKGAHRLIDEGHPCVLLEIEEDHCRRYGYQVADIYSVMQDHGYGYFYRLDNMRLSVAASSTPGQCGDVLFATQTLRGIDLLREP